MKNFKTYLSSILLVLMLAACGGEIQPAQATPTQSDDGFDVVAVATSYAATQTALPPVQPPNWITIEDRHAIGEDRVKNVILAAEEWVKKYGSCPQSIVISPIAAEKNALSGGVTETVLETASPGKLQISPEGSAYHITLHAMTHACSGDTISIDPMPFEDGIITGYQGLGILVTLKNGEQSMFSKIEEAIAERNASVFPGYTIGDYRYHNLGILGRKLFPETDQLVIQYLKTSDVPSFVATIIGKSRENVTVEDIVRVMQMFQDEWDKKQ